MSEIIENKEMLKTLTKIKSIFGDISKEKQESLTDDVLDFLEKMEKKYIV